MPMVNTVNAVNAVNSVNAVKVLLDTNFLLLPGKFKIDIFSQLHRLFGTCDIAIADVSFEELNNIANGHSKEARQAKLGLSLLQAKNVSVVSADKHQGVDDALAQLAKEDNWILATDDAELRKKARQAGVKTVFVRKKQYLVLE